MNCVNVLWRYFEVNPAARNAFGDGDYSVKAATCINAFQLYFSPGFHSTAAGCPFIERTKGRYSMDDLKVRRRLNHFLKFEWRKNLFSCSNSALLWSALSRTLWEINCLPKPSKLSRTLTLLLKLAGRPKSHPLDWINPRESLTLFPEQFYTVRFLFWLGWSSKYSVDRAKRKRSINIPP